MTRETYEKLKKMGIPFDDDFEKLIVIPLEEHIKKIEAERIKAEIINKEKEASKENEIEFDNQNNIKREIYLSFDDGLEQGTEEILELLKEKKVKATFFLIGKRVESIYKRDKNLCLKLLKDIYENHALGNHSYSHANESYNSYYREGGVVIKEENGKKVRRSVVSDFTKSKNTILYCIALMLGKSNPVREGYSDSLLKSKNQKNILARFPGTNTWYIKDKIIDIKYTNRINYKELPIQDTKEEAEALGKTYNIYGWDCEWKMGKPRTNDLIRATIKDKVDKKTINYENLADTDPFFDLYNEKYINYDRTVQSVEEIKDELLDIVYTSKKQPFDETGKKNGKAILLMHDRQFRKGKLNSKNELEKNDKTELKKLSELIDYFKEIKAEFKTLDEY